MSNRPEIVDSGLLYGNKYPADWAIHAYYSRIVEIRPGELLCVYRRAQALYGDDGRTWVLRSTDGGKTWQDEGCLWDGKQDAMPYSYSATHLTRTSTGEVLVMGHRFTRPTPDTPMYDAESGAHLPTETVLFRSNDDGHTWLPPEIVHEPDPHYLLYDSITELDNGRYFVTSDWDRLPNDTDHV
ncbi:MAG: sialidase family protein [Chloroflexi bacterium]|nr:sialidase family protein [Chloroflexota bacterium]